MSDQAQEASVMEQEVTASQAPEAVEVDDAITPEEEAELSSEEQAAVDAASEKPKTAKLTKDEKKAAEKLYDLKVNGKKLSVNEEELIKRAQKAEAADEKFQRASLIEKQAEQLIDLLKNDPLQILRNPNLGVDVKKLAQQIYEEELKEAEKSPEQKEKERLEAELEEIKRQYEEEMTRRQKEEYERIVAQQEREITEGIMTAIDTSGLPKSEYIVKRMTDIMLVAYENGLDLSPKDVVPILRKELKNELSRIPPEVLEEFLGEESVKGLRKNYLKKLKSTQSPATQAPTQTKAVSTPPQEEKQVEKIRASEFFRNLK
jgi:hypothetical protein